jgi:hypothetical protein
MPEPTLTWTPVPLHGSGEPSRTADRTADGCWQISRQQAPAESGQGAEYHHLWRRDPATGAVSWVYTYYDADAARARAAAEAAAAHA